MSQDKHRATDAGAGAAGHTNTQNKKGGGTGTEHDAPAARPPGGNGSAKGGAAEPKAAPAAKPDEIKGTKPDEIKGARHEESRSARAEPSRAADTAPPRAGNATGDRRRGGTAIAAISLVLTLGVIGAGAWFWGQQYSPRQHELDRQLAAVRDGAGQAERHASAVEQKVSGLQDKVASLNDSVQAAQAERSKLSAKVDGAVGDMQSTSQDLKAAVQKVHDELQRSSDDWIAAEAEYLIRVASQRLQLTGDTRTAMRALEDADRRLKDMGDPSLLDVRKKLADDIVALRAVDQPDVAGMSLTLSGLSDHVADLPIAGAQPVMADLTQTHSTAQTTAATEQSAWRRYLDRLWAGLQQLVVIRHQGETGKPMLTPDERVILRQNLRLQLEAARVALLRGDTKVFHDSLAGADKWLNEYFDTQAQPVTSMRHSLQSLKATDLAPQLPDLSGDLKALRVWEQRHTGKAGTASRDVGTDGKAAS